jgi:hypothetical protein
MAMNLNQVTDTITPSTNTLNIATSASLVANTITSPSATALIIQSAGTTALTIDTSQNITTTNKFAKASMPVGSVLQVVSTTLTTGFSASVNNSFSAVTGLTASITPTSSSSKVMVLVTMTVGSDTNYLNAQLTRGGSAISGAIATTAGNRSLGTSAAWPVASYGTYDLTLSYLDSPATTSATTYGVQIGHHSTATLCVNQSQADENVAGRTRGTSTITVMEIAA